MGTEFTIFSFAHMLTLVVITILIAVILNLLQRFRKFSLSRGFSVFLGCLVLINALFWRGILLVKGDFLLSENLPCHLCGVIPYLLAFYLFFPWQDLFDVLYYWIITGSTLALIIPDIEQGFPSYQFLSHFITHAVPLFVMLFLLIVRREQPSYHSYNKAFLVFFFFALLVVFPINLLTGGNYLYLLEPPEVDFSPVELLPPWPWYLGLLGVFFYLLYIAVYQPFRRVLEEELEGKEKPIIH